MKILFLHGWQSVPGGLKPTHLARHGHDVINPKLHDEDFAEACRIAQDEFDRHQPEVVVGSSRGGAVALNIDSGTARLVLLCPAWKKWGAVKTAKPGTVILHSRADDVIPFADSEELVRISGLPAWALIEVGGDHRLADPDSQAAMLRACEEGAGIPTFTCPPRVKVCCISSVEEARLAVQCGAAALGLVSSMPSGPGVISEETITEIARTIPPSVGSFLLTSRQTVAGIIEQQRRCRVNTIQICDHLTEGQYNELRDVLPGVALVQVVHVTGEESLAEACSVAAAGIDAILLDSGNQRLQVKELGGTGRQHDWTISRRIRDAVSVPIFLAGGLRADNVSEAVCAVRPFGLDLCTGVRTEGTLDVRKLRSFFTAVRASV